MYLICFVNKRNALNARDKIETTVVLLLNLISMLKMFSWEIDVMNIYIREMSKVEKVNSVWFMMNSCGCGSCCDLVWYNFILIWKWLWKLIKNILLWLWRMRHRWHVTLLDRIWWWYSRLCWRHIQLTMLIFHHR